MENHIQDLRSPDPSKRREAIIALGKLADARALPYLAKVYQSDPDAAIRELAAKAGRHIKGQQSQTNTPRPTPPSKPPSPPLSDPSTWQPPSLDASSLTADDSQPKRKTSTSEMPKVLPFVLEDVEPAQPPPNDLLSAYRKPQGSDSSSNAPLKPPTSHTPGFSPTYASGSSFGSSGSDSGSSFGGYSGGSGIAGLIEDDEPPSSKNFGGPSSVPAYDPSVPLSKKEVTKAERERAESLVKSAYGYVIRNDEENAIIELAKALRLNPELMGSTSVRNLAAKLVGGSGKDSVEMILQRGSQGQLKHKGKSFDTSGFVDLALSFIVLFVVLVFFTLGFAFAGIVIGEQILSSSFGADPDFIALRAELDNIDILASLPELARSQFVSLFGTLINLLVVYWIGTLQGGVADILRFLRAMFNFYTASYIWFVVLFLLLILSMFSGNTALLTSVVPILSIVLIISLFAILIAQVWVVKRQQEYGWGKALGSVILGGIATGLLLAIFNINLA